MAIPVAGGMPRWLGRRAAVARAACGGGSGGGGSGGMQPRLGRYATAAAPACATILAIMPTLIEPTPAGIPCQDALPISLRAVA